MFWIALTALMSLPTPLDKRVPDVRALFSIQDFPDYLLRQGTSRTVYTRTTVRQDGVVESCAAETSSGDPKLDAYTCALILKRAKFVPATWTDGSPVFGVIRVPVSWMIVDAPMSDEETLRATVPHLELTVNRLPKGARSIAGVNLTVAADENGRILACEEYTALKTSRKRHFPELVPIACKQVIAALTVPVPLDAARKPVRSVQSVTVHFKLDH